MEKALNPEEAEELLTRLVASLPKEECRSCDCLQGLLTQLELDLGSEVRHLTKPLKVPDSEIRGCLGCNPCPPADIFTEYIRKRNRKFRE